jgi:hypothetical protein
VARALAAFRFRAGCPVLAAAVEEPVEAVPSQPRVAAAEVFARWQGHLAQPSLPTATNSRLRTGWPAW